MMLRLLAAVAFVWLSGLSSAWSPPQTHVGVKRQISQLRESYDFVVAGGGTCGLTVADRISEAFPNKTVLVIEYGQIEYATGGFDPPQTVWGGNNPNAASTWNFQSLPNPEFRNKTATVIVGKVVGGSSAINGMFFDRASRFDFDSWDQAGSPEFDGLETKWNWNATFPFYKKSVTFTEPSGDVVQKYGYTWDRSAFGNSTPIYSTLPPFLWGDHPIVRGAWKDMGIPALRECGGGDKAGVCWIPISEHPITARRSHAGIGHYAAVNTTRSNYDLLVRHQVTRVIYPNGLEKGPPTVEVRSLADNRTFHITPKGEVILSAGSVYTPTILQRSGIGPASVLKAAGIPVVLDLPGVGSNFQDHGGPAIAWNYTTPLNITDPLPADMLITSFADGAAADFNAIPARGPYTLSMANSALYLSLSSMTSNSTKAAILSRIQAQISNTTLAASLLPPDYRSDPSMVAGYLAQLRATADLYANPDAPSTEVPWATGTAARIFLLRPLSRGTVRLNPADHIDGIPLVDYRSGSNPVDFDIHLAHMRYMRKMISTPTMKSYNAVEIGPGPGIGDEDEEKLKEYVKDQMTLTFYHACCTAAMLPRQKGGVVGPDMKVHGTKGLRVVDMSVLPLAPAAHLSATAYAVGEKAADIIIREWA